MMRRGAAAHDDLANRDALRKGHSLRRVLWKSRRRMPAGRGSGGAACGLEGRGVQGQQQRGWWRGSGRLTRPAVLPAMAALAPPLAHLQAGKVSTLEPCNRGPSISDT